MKYYCRWLRGQQGDGERGRGMRQAIKEAQRMLVMDLWNLRLVHTDPDHELQGLIKSYPVRRLITRSVDSYIGWLDSGNDPTELSDGDSDGA